MWCTVIQWTYLILCGTQLTALCCWVGSLSDPSRSREHQQSHLDRLLRWTQVSCLTLPYLTRKGQICIPPPRTVTSIRSFGKQSPWTSPPSQWQVMRAIDASALCMLRASRIALATSRSCRIISGAMLFKQHGTAFYAALILSRCVSRAAAYHCKPVSTFSESPYETVKLKCGYPPPHSPFTALLKTAALLWELLLDEVAVLATGRQVLWW